MSEQRGFTQRSAAQYLGVSVRYFRDHIHVEPVPVGEVRPGVKPLLRYLREDLDAILDRWKEQRTA
jgi:hypothetical protein